MTEELRNEIIARSQQGASQPKIARDLGLSRASVQRVLRRLRGQRGGQAVVSNLPKPKQRRASLLDPFESIMRELLERYPNMTGRRLFEELRGRGYQGQYTMVRERVRLLRPRPPRPPVIRFDTGPGLQGQMDFGVYDIDFRQEGRRRVYLFSYLLSYSRRQYLRFCDAQDFTTTIREHVRAFEHLQGVAATCLYDNMKVVVLRHGDDGPLYNPRFLAFATHYGFKPWACRVRRPQTKGKVERAFHFAEVSLLNGRSFDTLEHLNEVTAWWLANVADVRVHRETRQTPLQRHAEEAPHLIPLPAQPYDTSAIVYRSVNADGFIAYRQNLYAVPWRYIGAIVPVRLTEHELFVYSPQIEEIVRHSLAPRGVSGQRIGRHQPHEDPQERQALLEQRFTELGPLPHRFFVGLVSRQRQGKHQAQHVLALLAGYERQDWLAALERAVRFGAFSLAAVERILAATARPKSVLASLADQERQHLDPLLRDNPVTPRPTTEYQSMLNSEDNDGPPIDTHERSNERSIEHGAGDSPSASGASA